MQIKVQKVNANASENTRTLLFFVFLLSAVFYVTLCSNWNFATIVIITSN